MWMELALDEEETQKNGMAFIGDMGGLPMRIFKFLTPKATIKCALKEEVRGDCHNLNRDRVFNLFSHPPNHLTLYTVQQKEPHK
jgi:hypothetical protein